MENKNKWGKCPRCGKEITDKTIGDRIEAEEVLICDSCSKKHRLYLIRELNKFRLSKDFRDKPLALRKKILWSSEQMGHKLDSWDKSYLESVSDYDNYNPFELQVTLLETLQTLLLKEIYPDLETDFSKKYPELEKLRLEVEEQQEKILSYIDKMDFIYK